MERGEERRELRKDGKGEERITLAGPSACKGME